MIDKLSETELLSIIKKLHAIRIDITEGQGQGFLINAEQNIASFISFQKTLEKLTTTDKKAT